MLTILIINIFLFLIYNGYIIYKYGIPNSLSETAYMLNTKKWLFTLLCLITAGCILPIWFGGDDWDFLKFLSMIGLAFTGVTPMFKEGLDKPVHYTSSIITCICMLLWLGLNGFWWSLGIGIGLFIILTCIDYKRVVYYGEICCWLGLLITLAIR